MLDGPILRHPDLANSPRLDKMAMQRLAELPEASLIPKMAALDFNKGSVNGYWHIELVGTDPLSGRQQAMQRFNPGPEARDPKEFQHFGTFESTSLGGRPSLLGPLNIHWQ